MAEHGGFEHNLQSLRVIDQLEQRYPLFDGLNLTFETREGVLKHCSRTNAEALEAAEPIARQSVGRRFLDRTQPSLEAQLCNLADEIAYNAHDIDDGVRSGLITLVQLQEVPLFDEFRCAALAEHPHLDGVSQGRRLLYETIRRMLSAQVYDVISTTGEALARHKPQDADAARQQPPLVQFGATMQVRSQVLKKFLLHRLYRHPQVVHMTGRASQVVTDLFKVYWSEPGQMQAGSTETPARAVADYIAGMTDRFAAREHERITGLRLLAPV
jgi:dGTPase